MQAIVSKMRGQINEYRHGRATTKEVDWRLEKRRKTTSSSSTPSQSPLCRGDVLPFSISGLTEWYWQLDQRL